MGELEQKADFLEESHTTTEKEVDKVINEEKKAVGKNQFQQSASVTGFCHTIKNSLPYVFMFIGWFGILSGIIDNKAVLLQFRFSWVIVKGTYFKYGINIKS